MNLPLVVGTIHSDEALRRALRLRAGAVDVLELRVDHFAERASELRRAAGDLPAPLIVTVRHPREGGAQELSTAQRRGLFEEFLPCAAYVDVELRSLTALSGVLAAARHAQIQVIISDHHFRQTPSARVLRERWQLAQAARASITKVAGQIENADDLGRLLGLFAQKSAGRLSVMGMGPLGKVSRLLFARLGSALNYGYLAEPQVTGQWEAALLKQRIADLFGP